MYVANYCIYCASAPSWVYRLSEINTLESISMGTSKWVNWELWRTTLLGLPTIQSKSSWIHTRTLNLTTSSWKPPLITAHSPSSVEPALLLPTYSFPDSSAGIHDVYKSASIHDTYKARKTGRIQVLRLSPTNCLSGKSRFYIYVLFFLKSQLSNWGMKLEKFIIYSKRRSLWIEICSLHTCQISFLQQTNSIDQRTDCFNSVKWCTGSMLSLMLSCGNVILCSVGSQWWTA